MKLISVSIFTLFICVLSANADLREILPNGGSIVLNPAKDPVAGDIVRMELEEGYRYQRHLCIYVRATGRSSTRWGYKSEVHLGLLWQYDISSSVLYSDQNYTVELLQFRSGPGTGQLLVESQRQLDDSLSSHTRTLIQEWDQSNSGVSEGNVLNSASKALYEARFLGVPIQKREGDNVLLKAKDDTIRALSTDFGLPGNSFLVIYDLKNMNSPPLIERIVAEGDTIAKWEPVAATNVVERQKLLEQTSTMIELVKNSCMSLDRSIVPGGTLYEPGSVWKVSARDLSPLISPAFHRIDQSTGELEFMTDNSMRSFAGAPAFKVFNTKTRDQNRLLFKKELSERDKKSDDQARHWKGTLAMTPDRFEGFIAPSGENSYLRFVYVNGNIEYEGEQDVSWWPNVAITSEVKMETLYYCRRERMPTSDRSFYRSALTLARDMFSSKMSNEDCPWNDKIDQP